MGWSLANKSSGGFLHPRGSSSSAATSTWSTGLQAAGNVPVSSQVTMHIGVSSRSAAWVTTRCYYLQAWRELGLCSGIPLVPTQPLDKLPPERTAPRWVCLVGPSACACLGFPAAGWSVEFLSRDRAKREHRELLQPKGTKQTFRGVSSG